MKNQFHYLHQCIESHRENGDAVAAHAITSLMIYGRDEAVKLYPTESAAVDNALAYAAQEMRGAL